MQVNPRIKSLLIPAYSCCSAFSGPCQAMKWNPKKGHIPRGFYGGVGSVDEVRLFIVCAEPGDPHSMEDHSKTRTPEGYFNSAYSYVGECIREGKDQFHVNIRKIIDLCFPGLSFGEQMKKVFITDAVLCSANKECENIKPGIEKECGVRYLKKIHQLFPNAITAALGKKAQHRLQQIGITSYISARAAAPPGCNRKDAILTWMAIAKEANKSKLTRVTSQ